MYQIKITRDGAGNVHVEAPISNDELKSIALVMLAKALEAIANYKSSGLVLPQAPAKLDLKPGRN